MERKWMPMPFTHMVERSSTTNELSHFIVFNNNLVKALWARQIWPRKVDNILGSVSPQPILFYPLWLNLVPLHETLIKSTCQLWSTLLWIDINVASWYYHVGKHDGAQEPIKTYVPKNIMQYVILLLLFTQEGDHIRALKLTGYFKRNSFYSILLSLHNNA